MTMQGINKAGGHLSGYRLISGFVIIIIALMAIALVVNQKEVNTYANNLKSVQQDVIDLSEEIHIIADDMRQKGTSLHYQESLIRERLNMVAPGEYIIKIDD